MSEEFKEYKRRNTKHTEKTTKNKKFSKKFLYQMISSAIIFAVVFFINSANTPFTQKIRLKLKDAFSYTIDTSGVTDAIDKIFKNNQGKGEIQNETNEQDSLIKDI